MSIITDISDSSFDQESQESSLSTTSLPDPHTLIKHLNTLCETSDLTFQEFCSKTFNFLSEEIPVLKTRIETFKTERINQRFLEKWKGVSWNEIKAACKQGKISEEEMNACHAFRIRAKNEIEKLIELTLAHFQYSPIHWQMVGTPGWASDIDNSALSHQLNGELSVTLGKLLFDALWFHSFGELSGVQVDLETYTAHAGERETFLQLQTEEGKKRYAGIAFLGAHVALIRSMDQKQWQAYRKDFLESHQTQFGIETANIYASLMDDVEAFHNESEKEVLREAYLRKRSAELSSLSPLEAKQCAENDFKTKSLEELKQFMGQVDLSHRDCKLARYNFKMAKLFRIGCQIDYFDKQIDLIEEKLAKHHHSRSYHPNYSSKADEEIVTNLILEIDLCHTEIARLSILRETMQDEGYITQGAYLNVCKHQGSQIDTRTKETISKEMSKVGYSLLRPYRQRTSKTHELLESVLENGAGHFHKMHHYAHDPIAALIESAKYSKRVIDAALPLISHSKSSSQAQQLLTPKVNTPSTLLLSLKRKTLADDMLKTLVIRGLENQNEKIKELLAFMNSKKEQAPLSEIKNFFYACLHEYFSKNQTASTVFDVSLRGYFDKEFEKFGNDWDELCAHLAKCFPICSDVKKVAAVIESKIQLVQKNMGIDYQLISSTDRYKLMLQQLGMQTPLVALNPGNLEPIEPLLGAVLAAFSNYQRHNFYEALNQILETQKEEIMHSLGITNIEEATSFTKAMNESMQSLLIEIHTLALSQFNHPIAAKVVLQV